MPVLAISDDFARSLARLPRGQQKKVWDFTSRFRRNPRAKGIHFERIQHARDPKVRSVRIDLKYRAILVHPSEGDLYLLVWVDLHDAAYAWARKRRFDIHPTSGALQMIVVPSEEKKPLAGPRQPAEKIQNAANGGLFEQVSNADLALLGVPPLLQPSIRALVTEKDLDELAPVLPAEVADALYLLAAGFEPEAVRKELDQPARPAEVNVQDFAAALKHPDSKRRFKVVESEADLEQMLEAPLALWRVFLHPTQRKLVTMQAKGPIRVLGGAGTGKTVALLHRARYLARNVFTKASDRILVTTFTRNLACDLEVHLKQICGDEMERIEVAHLHLWAVRLLRARGITFDILNQQQGWHYWDEALSSCELCFPASFYREEWEKVVQAQDITTREEYFKIARVGRGRRLGRKGRGHVWEVLKGYRALLDGDGKVEWPDVVRETRLFLEHQRQTLSLPYRAVLADEVQDLRPADLRLLRAMVPAGGNDLFLVGDAHQRIYGHRASMSSCGIDIRGRSRRLRLNYRTTQRIQSWAVALLEGLAFDDLDGGLDSLKACHSLRVGARPELHHFRGAEQEAHFILERLRAWLRTTKPEQICLAARTQKLIKNRYKPLLEGASIPSVVVEIEAEENLGPGVRLATMHRLKGLEFPHVLIAAVQEGIVPYRPSFWSTAEATTRADFLRQERSLLYVAATRARDEVLLTGFGQPSEFLEDPD